jgi:hypothetical protein
METQRKEQTMSDPNEQQQRQEPDELELEPEMVKDLDVDEDDAGQIRGGCSGSGTISVNRNTWASN